MRIYYIVVGECAKKVAKKHWKHFSETRSYVVLPLEKSFSFIIKSLVIRLKFLLEKLPPPLDLLVLTLRPLVHGNVSSLKIIHFIIVKT